MAKPYTYTIFIPVPQPHWIQNIWGICHNYLTHNETAIITRTTMLTRNQNKDGAQVKVIDYNPSKIKKENEQNATNFAHVLLSALYQQTAIIESQDGIREVTNERNQS